MNISRYTNVINYVRTERSKNFMFWILQNEQLLLLFTYLTACPSWPVIIIFFSIARCILRIKYKYWYIK